MSPGGPPLLKVQGSLRNRRPAKYQWYLTIPFHSSHDIRWVGSTRHRRPDSDRIKAGTPIALTAPRIARTSGQKEVDRSVGRLSSRYQIDNAYVLPSGFHWEL